MPTIKYTPQKKSRQAEIMSVCAMVVALLLYAFSSYLGSGGGITKALLQVTALAIGALGVHLLIRFGMTGYRYELHDDNLVVYRIVGKNDVMICDLSLKTAIGLYRKSELPTEEVPENGSQPPNKPDHTINYVVSFGCEDPYCYLYHDADAVVMILLEADDAFATELRMRMTTSGPYDDI